MKEKELILKELLKKSNLIAVIIALLTTGFLRLQLFTSLPETDGGEYTFASQYIYSALSNGGSLQNMPLYLYQLMTSWVYGLDVNQYILLRLIDGLVAIAASIILVKVILKESGSTLFTIILSTTLLILLNSTEFIGYGYKNSIWAAYFPLFSALLVWQNSTKEDKYSFYLIGGLVSLGILLREAFLLFFLLAGISILITHGWRVLFKYLIGSAVLGFSVLGYVLMYRDWDLIDLINSYLGIMVTYGSWNTSILHNIIFIIKFNWFIFITVSISTVYLIKLYWGDKKLVNMSRLYFWLAIALLPILEPILKTGFPYHYAISLIGLAGLSSMGWKYLSEKESKKVNIASLTIIGLMSLFIIFPKVNSNIIKNSYIYSPLDAINISTSEIFRIPEMIEKSQYLIAAAKIYEHSNDDSTLAVSGVMGVIYPLTKLLPPTFKLNDLGRLYVKLNYDESKLIKIIEEYRPTLIMTSGLPGYEKAISAIIDKSDLYEIIGFVHGDLDISYGWKFTDSAIIYRLKDFK